MNTLGYRSAFSRGWVIWVTGLTLSACQFADPQQDSALVNTRWTLVNSIRQNGHVERPRPGDFTFVLIADGSMVGNALCNACGGDYNLIGSDSLVINGFCTEKGCPTWLQSLNGGFPPGGTYHFEIKGDELYLTSDGGASRYVYRPL